MVACYKVYLPFQEDLFQSDFNWFIAADCPLIGFEFLISDLHAV